MTRWPTAGSSANLRARPSQITSASPFPPPVMPLEHTIATNLILEFPDTTGNNGGNYRYWQYSVGVPFGNGPTFTQFTGPAASSFSFLFTLVPQLGSPDGLDGIGDRLMFRLAYRNFGSPA